MSEDTPSSVRFEGCQRPASAPSASFGPPPDPITPPARGTFARRSGTVAWEGTGQRQVQQIEATVRAVDYLVVGAASEQFRVYSDDERDVARWRRVETPESPWTPDPAG